MLATFESFFWIIFFNSAKENIQRKLFSENWARFDFVAVFTPCVGRCCLEYDWSGNLSISLVCLNMFSKTLETCWDC